MPLVSAEVTITNIDEQDLSPLNAGSENYLNFSAENSLPYPVETKYELEISSTQDVNASEQDFSTNFIDGSGKTQCEFSGNKSWKFHCPSEKLILESNSQKNFGFEITPAPNLIGGSKLKFSLSTSNSFGEMISNKSFASEENPSAEFGNLSLETAGSEVSGDISRYKSLILENATSSENLELFAVNLSGTDQLNMEYGFERDLIRNQFYTFELFRYNEGWNKLETQVSAENLTVSADIEGSGFYSLNIDREQMTIQELRDRSTKVEKSVDGSEASLKFEGLGEGEELAVQITEIAKTGSISTQSIDLISEVNNTGQAELELSRESIEYNELGDPDFNEEGYLQVDTDSLEVEKIGFNIDNDVFEYRNNVGSFRNSGEGWKELSTSFIQQDTDTSLFEAATEGNSEFLFGVFKSNILVSGIESPEKILDNETLEVEVELTNRGRGKGEKQINLSIDDNVVDQQTVEVEGSTTSTYTFERKLDPGNYTISVDGKEAETEVALRELKWRILDRMPFNDIRILYGLGALTGLVVIMIVLFVLKRYVLKGTKFDREIKKGIEHIKHRKDGETEDSAENDQVESNDDDEKTKDEVEEKQSGPQYKCDECGRSFGSKDEFELHKRNVHEVEHEEGEGDYMCALCGESFDTSAGLELHHSKFHE